ncbi:MAG: sulfotransferase domain-containing protein [Actinomycetota bacterium]|nr:sulfotransferase domain-containing protein [Actinomycetota bacterium]
MSPWLDWLFTPRKDLYARLAAQRHRRFIKTHTPLEGIPLDSRVTYVVVARHPLDMAVSLYHQSENLDRVRLRKLTGQAHPTQVSPHRPPLHEWVLSWIDGDEDPQEQLDSLPGVMWHFSDAWRRKDESNVVLVHYDDLPENLESEMRRLAALLEIEVPDATWPNLVEAAHFETMKARADRLAPDPSRILKSRQAFFKSGRSGSRSNPSFRCGTGPLPRPDGADGVFRPAGLAASRLFAAC